VGGERATSRLNDIQEGAPVLPRQYAVTIKRAAELLSLCTKTVRHKIARGEIPAIGTGRTTRVLMPDALHALSRLAPPKALKATRLRNQMLQALKPAAPRNPAERRGRSRQPLEGVEHERNRNEATAMRSRGESPRARSGFSSSVTSTARPPCSDGSS